MKQVAAGDLDIAYLETGPADGAPVVLLHGFPYDVRAYGAVSVRLAEAGMRTIVPYLRGYGPTRFRKADTVRSGQQAALGADLLALMDALEIPQAVLAGYDWGGRAACILAALRPERVRGLVSGGAGYNIQDIPKAMNPGPPEEEYRYWYQYYFHSERGYRGLTENRKDLCRFIWRLWSPSWSFDEETYQQSATSFDNPDFVDVVTHSYRHRYGGVAGDPRLDGMEARLAEQPDIAVPTVVLEGGDDGVDPPPERDRSRPHFSGPYERRVLPGVGHNIPQEAPEAFTEAVLSLR